MVSFCEEHIFILFLPIQFFRNSSLCNEICQRDDQIVVLGGTVGPYESFQLTWKFTATAGLSFLVSSVIPNSSVILKLVISYILHISLIWKNKLFGTKISSTLSTFSQCCCGFLVSKIPPFCLGHLKTLCQWWWLNQDCLCQDDKFTLYLSEIVLFTTAHV